MGARVRGWRWMEVPVSAMCQLTISRFRVESGDYTSSRLKIRCVPRFLSRVYGYTCEVDTNEFVITRIISCISRHYSDLRSP